MDILSKITEVERELTSCYAIIQLQDKQIKDLTKTVEHLEKLLLHKAHKLDFNKE